MPELCLPARLFKLTALLLTLVAAATLSFGSAASAQDTLRGVALVIGNGEYEHLSPLANPPDDADAIEELLSDLGFDSLRRSDRDAKDLARDLERFVEDAEGADVAVLYYAGHGIEAGGENFLIPVDADISALDDAARKLVPVSDVLRRLRETVAITIILLDACRDNPFPADATLRLTAGAEALPIAAGGLAVADTRGATSLAQTSTPAANDNFGAVIGFAASPGQVALDGTEGEHSPYAAALIRHIDAMAGQEFGTVMRMVAEEVYLKTSGRQRPWVNESLRRLLYFGDTPEPVTGPDGEILTERRSLLLTIAGLPDFNRKQIERVASQGGVPMDALYGMLKALGQDVPDDPVELEQLLRRQAEELKSFLAERRIIENPDPELARLSALSDDAIADGAIATARRLRMEVDRRIDELSAVIDREEENIRNRRIEFAAEYARSAEVSALTFDNADAADYYRKAFQQVERWDDRLAWEYRKEEIRQMLNHNAAVGDFAEVQQADKLAGSLVLAAGGLGKEELTESRLVHASTRSVIATQSLDLNVFSEAVDLINAALDDLPGGEKRGEALQRLGIAMGNLASMTGDLEHLDKAIAAFREALTFMSAEKNPQTWLDVSVLLANAIAQTGLRDLDSSKIREGIAILEQAKNHIDAEDSPVQRVYFELQLAALQISLPDLEQGLNSFSADTADEIIAELKSSRQRIPREQFPRIWAQMDAMLGSLQFDRAKMTDDEDILDQAIASLNRAVEYHAQTRSAADWAGANETLGQALNNSASRSKDLNVYQLAITAHENALTVVQPGENPQRWGHIRFRLSFALREAGLVSDDPAFLQRANEVTRTTLDEPAIAALPGLQTDLYLQLGYTLGRLHDAGGEQAHLDEALLAFETVAKNTDPASTFDSWIDAQYGIADIARRLDASANGTNYLRRSVEASLLVLEHFDRTDRYGFGVFSADTAVHLNTIAQRDNDSDAGRKAVTLFDDAAKYVDASEHPIEFANILGNRANALGTLDRIEPDQDWFDRARGDYKAAIELYHGRDREAEARNWRNLGLLYRNHDHLMRTNDWQAEALAAFKAAVEAYDEPTNDFARADLFRAHYNVGETLADLKFAGADARHLSQIVAAFANAVSIPPKVAGEINWADGQHRLGLVLYELGRVEDDIAAFKKAQAAFDAALTIRTSDSDFGAWFASQTAAADNFYQLAYRAGGADYYEEALSIYQEILDLYPARWTRAGVADYRVKKANTLYQIASVTGNVDTLREAASAYRSALAVDREDDPVPFHIDVGRRLGDSLKYIARASSDIGTYRKSAAAYRDVLDLIPKQGSEQLRAEVHRDLGLVLSTIADAGGDTGAIEEAIANLNGATGYFTRQSDPAAWAYLINNRAWLNIVAGRRDGDLSRFERAATALRDVVVVQREVQDSPNLAYSEDSLCAALVELGEAKKKKPLLEEAIGICSHAVDLLRSQKLDAIAEDTGKLLARAQASLGELTTARP